MKPTKLLIDSHVFIWLLYEPEKVSPKVQQLIQTADAVYISLVSLWELALKFDKKKLAYSPKELAAGIKALNLQILPLETEHIVGIAKIGLTHKDPFDKLLISQSQAEGCVLLTADSHLLKSSYQTFKAD